MLSGGTPQNNRMYQFMGEFEKFKRSFSGDPRAEVQRLLNTGQMTQDQYNKLAEMTKQISSMMPRK
jgi:hypothetical protein